MKIAELTHKQLKKICKYIENDDENGLEMCGVPSWKDVACKEHNCPMIRDNSTEGNENEK